MRLWCQCKNNIILPVICRKDYYVSSKGNEAYFDIISIKEKEYFEMLRFKKEKK